MRKQQAEESNRKPVASRKTVSRLSFYCLLSILYCLLLPILLPVAAQRGSADDSAASSSSSSSQAQATGLNQWGAVTLFHGLPSDRVRAIAQDNEGAMWFGTDGGLAKYDGRRTQAIVGGGLTRGRVLALKFDAEGALWIGTEDGATRLSGGEFRRIEETAGYAVTAIIAPERGRAVLASERGVIFDCRTQADGSLTARTLPDQPLVSADSDHPGELNLTSLAYTNDSLLAGTLSRGLVSFERDRPDRVKEVQSRPRAFFINAIEMDGDGRVWFGAKAKADDSGLYQAGDLSRPLKVGAGLGTVTALRAGVARRGDLWVGTDGHGVFHYDGAHLTKRFTFEGTAGGLRSDRVYSIFVDREDVVWFGTDKGVCRYDPHALRVENVSEDAGSNFVRTLFRASDGRLMCGTNRGLFTGDDAQSTWHPVEALVGLAVYAITEERDGLLLVGSANGLYRSAAPAREVNGATRFERIVVEEMEAGTTDSVRAISRFQGATYIATYGRGLERLDGARRTLVWPTGTAEARAREVVSLYADDPGAKLWIGTAGAGVFLFDGKQVSKDTALEKLGGSAVWDIEPGDEGWHWLATGNGLYRYRPGELTAVVPNLDARSVITTGERDGSSGDGGPSRQAWCATAGGGLLKVLIDERIGPLVSRLDVEQGLPSQSAFAVLRLRRDDPQGDETLLIGTSRGLARYEPGRIPPNLTPTRIISRRIHQAEELRSGELSLEYPQNSLVLDVSAASSRTFPEQFQYAFFLYDNAGKVVKQKFSHDAQLTMESLRPGRYRVVARAYNVDLTASLPLEFEFSVAGAPFPWTTAALSVLLALALAALWWGYFQNRRIARASTELMEANRQLADARLQVANQTEVERRRIARDLHDQTLADLRHLLLLTDQLSTNGDEDKQRQIDPATFRVEIESISTEVRRICEDLSPSVLENVGFAAALEWAISNAVTHSPPDCKFEYEFASVEDLEERMELAPGVRMQIYRIVQEAVSNICRHAEASRVRLNVDLSPGGAFVLTLEDDGRDFNPEDKKLKHGRGLTNIRARASLIEATVAWNKRAGGGTVFTLRKANVVKDASTN
ncbi:MAG: two-component regulator propeller domain-containing protein [Pyrinomonadaceae bacterium]